MITKDQVNIIERLLNYVLLVSNEVLVQFQKDTGISKSELEEMIKLVQSKKHGQINMNKLAVALNKAAEYADPKEIHTLIGYSWEEAQNLIKELRDEI